jgi:hypothetical protein
MTIRYISIVFTEEEDDDLLYSLEFAFNDVTSSSDAAADSFIILSA